jgi:hypothetical protein
MHHQGKDVVDIAEGIITLLLFPVLCLVSYWADVGMFSKDEDQAKGVKISLDEGGVSAEDIADYAKQIQQKFAKDLPEEKILKLLEQEMAPKKTRATYRSSVIRGITGQAGKGKTADKHKVSDEAGDSSQGVTRKNTY